MSRLRCIALLYLLISIAVSAANPTKAQDHVCTPDLSSVNASLAEAQSALDNSDTDATLSAIAEARASLELIEANCINFASDDDGDSRINPVPFGERKHIEEFSASIQITNYVADANDIVVEANNDPPGEDERYIIIEFLYTCDLTPAEVCEIHTGDFRVVGSRGIAYRRDLSVSVRVEHTPDEIFGGAQVTVALPMLVGGDETDFVIYNDDGDRVFFATQ